MRRPAPLALVLCALLACGGDGGGSGEITVAAAASLTDAFTEIGEGFEAANPGTTVTFTFASSGTLAEQIVGGAPVDVFASADEATMASVAEADRLAGEPEVVAGNELVIVTKPGNPEGIEALADLADVGVVALCSASAPCGRFAGQVLDGAGVEIPDDRVTRGQNVKATLTAVAQGDAAAGIVYVTDARAAGDAVETVPIPAGQNAAASYPITVLDGAGDAAVAEAFAAYVASDDGRAVLEEHGFLPPP